MFKRCSTEMFLTDDRSFSIVSGCGAETLAQFVCLRVTGMCVHWLSDPYATEKRRLAQVAGKWAAH